MGGVEVSGECGVCEKVGGGGCVKKCWGKCGEVLGEVWKSVGAVGKH